MQDLSGKIELIDDNIILNEEFKKNVAIPYFKDIYKDLAAQSDAKSKGINKVSILNVSPIHITLILQESALNKELRSRFMTNQQMILQEFCWLETLTFCTISMFYLSPFIVLTVQLAARYHR